MSERSEYDGALPDSDGYWWCGYWIQSGEDRPWLDEIMEVRMFGDEPRAWTNDSDGHWDWDPCRYWDGCYWAKSTPPPPPVTP